MHLSKLEVCLEIMKVINQKGPQTSTNIQAKIGESDNVIQGCLNFLVQQGILKERTNGAELAIYANTKRAKRVIEYFRFRDDCKVFSEATT